MREGSLHRPVKHKGITKAQLKEIPIVKAKKIAHGEEPQNCCICLEPMKEGQQLRLLPCGHRYHRKCADKWLKRKAVCPMDKRSVVVTKVF